MKEGNMFLDLDGLKFDTLPATAQYMNDRYAINSTATDYINRGSELDLVLWEFRPDLKHMTRDEIYMNYGNEFLCSIAYHEGILPIKDMPEVVSGLAKKYRLYTVTARQEKGQHVIKHLNNKYIPGCITNIHCVWSHNGTKYINIPKKDFIQSIPGKNVAFIDDSLHEVEDMQNVIPSYLFDQYDFYKNTPNIPNKLISWKEIGDKFL